MSSAIRIYIYSFIMLALALVGGTLASHFYKGTTALGDYISFTSLRPLHVSSIIYFIMSAAMAGVIAVNPGITHKRGGNFLLTTWIISSCTMIYTYLTGQFGGREYWEMPVWSVVPVIINWLTFLVMFLRYQIPVRPWPVYRWMWLTGVIFMVLTLVENYLWLLPYFRGRTVLDITVQWKVGGAMVGAWNQLLYGTLMYITVKCNQNEHEATRPVAFLLFFVGLINLMFNWGHHIYTLPTPEYIRIISYSVSMLEWIFLLKVIYNWKKTLNILFQNKFHGVYMYMNAVEVWVFLNLILAVMMSIPAFNIYLHGTYAVIAHSMGSTIGINTMIIFATLAYISEAGNPEGTFRFRVGLFYLLQISLFVFWVSLIYTGIIKGIELNKPEPLSFSEIMKKLQTGFQVFIWSGSVLAVAIFGSALVLIRRLFKNSI